MKLTLDHYLRLLVSGKITLEEAYNTIFSSSQELISLAGDQPGAQIEPRAIIAPDGNPPTPKDKLELIGPGGTPPPRLPEKQKKHSLLKLKKQHMKVLEDIKNRNLSLTEGMKKLRNFGVLY